MIPKKRMRSVEASRAIWNSKAQLTRAELLILQALASHANEDFECHPSVRRLAEMSRLSERQVNRLIHKLREKGQIAYNDNPGGQRKCNRYRLLVALNPDTANSDIGTAEPNPDTLLRNPDISSPETPTPSDKNPDIAMSDEWIEGFSEWETEWGGAPVLRNVWEAFAEITEDLTPEELIAQIENGAPIIRPAICDDHGRFSRPGSQFGRWIALAGRGGFYSGEWTADAGCEGCRGLWASLSKEQRRYPPLPVRTFELRTPVFCPDHGKYIFEARLEDYGADFAEQRHRRFEIGPAEWNSLCPQCDADVAFELDVQHGLRLSNDEWERGRTAILEALNIARGVSP